MQERFVRCGVLAKLWKVNLSFLRELVKSDELTAYDNTGEKANWNRSIVDLSDKFHSRVWEEDFRGRDSFRWKFHFDMDEVRRIEDKYPELGKNREAILSGRGQDSHETPYLNERHECYAPELAAAVSIWMELYSEETDPDKYRGKKEDKIKEHLKTNFPELYQKAIKQKHFIQRLSTLTNPQDAKTGGPRKTPGG